MQMAQLKKSLSKDIRPEFEKALSTKLDFAGTFSFNKTHLDAPNPSLKIQGLGTIGIPLSTRDAGAIKSKAEQAPFGMGEKTVIDTSVRDTWEIDANIVTFANPRWGPFMQTSVEEACKVLGVNYHASLPRCDPYKLLLYETGSHFLPHVDTEKVDGMFATIIVVFPSEHTGGEAHLSHNVIDVTYDCSQESLNATTVMAWYTDVMHEIRPIKSGYRLAMSFNLIHTTNSLRPAISTNSKFTEEVKRVLLSWKDMKGDRIPMKIVYLLDHRYSRANLRGSALKGVDDVKVSLLQQICREIGFSLGMATVVCRLAGSADDDRGGYYGKRHCGYSTSDSDTDDEDDLGFLEVNETEMTIKDFVNLDGTTISATLGINEATETIPANLAEDVQSGKHDEQEYEGYMGNVGIPVLDVIHILIFPYLKGAGSLERWYRRTVLVIWPNKNICDVLYPNKSVEYMCEKLEEANGRSESSMQLAEHVFSRIAESPDEAFTAVCLTALCWKDIALWRRLVETHLWHNMVSLLDTDDLEGAIETFGFPEVGECLEKAFTTSHNNRGILELIVVLEEIMEENPELEEECGKEAISSWVFKQRDNILRNLGRFDKDDVAIVVQTSISHGGMFPDAFVASVVPQLLALADSETLVKLAFEINKLMVEEDISADTGLISNLVVTAVTKFNFSQANSPPKPSGMASQSKTQNTESPDPNLETLKILTQACCSLGCAETLTLVLDRATLTKGLSPPDASKRARTVMLPFLDYIGLRSREFAGMFPEQSVKALAEVAIPLILSQPNELNEALTQSTMNALKLMDSGIEFIQTRVVPKILSPNVSPDAQLVVAEELMKLGTLLPDGTKTESFTTKVQPTIISLASKVAQGVRLSTLSITSVLRRVSRLGAMEACTAITQRFSSIARQATASQLQEIFIPQMSPLRELALSNSDLEPGTNTFIRTIVQRWVGIVLGRKPFRDRSELVLFNSWSCACTPCQRAKDLLRDASVNTPTLRLDCESAQARKHLEGLLTSCASKAVTFSTSWIMPQYSFIDLSENMKRLLRWEKNQSAGIKMLRDIATEEDQLQRVLGDYYNAVLQALGIQRIIIHATSGSDQVAAAAASTHTIAPGTIAQAETNRMGEPLAKKRKIFPNPADIIDLT